MKKLFGHKIILFKPTPHRFRVLRGSYVLILCSLCALVANSHAGGFWFADGSAVSPFETQSITQEFADSHYLQDLDATDKILIKTPGFGNDLKLHSSDADMKFNVGSGSGVLEIWAARMVVSRDVSISGKLSSASTAPDPEWEFPGRYVGNRDYNDNRYIQRIGGITVNHTIQTGDTLQIQNGIITAINP